MPTFNAISLVAENLKFSAKYPAPHNSCPENPLQGYFNYIHAVPLLERQSRGLSSNPHLINTLIEQFHNQELAAVKIKFALRKSGGQHEKPVIPPNQLKYSRHLNGMAINHDNFRADQIVSGCGNSYETLQCSIRIRGEHLNNTVRDKLNTEILNPSSNTMKDIEQGIRNAAGAGLALEVALQHTERALAPQVQCHLPGHFDLKIKLKRNQLFSNTRVVVSSSYFSADRGLSKTQGLPNLEAEAALPTHYTAVP